jgi:hypothetical protein
MVGLLSPERFLTKICMVSSGSAEDAREVEEEMLEMLLERMLAVCVDVLVVVAVAVDAVVAMVVAVVVAVMLRVVEGCEVAELDWYDRWREREREREAVGADKRTPEAVRRRGGGA